jgi:ankyrin repeat protein
MSSDLFRAISEHDVKQVASLLRHGADPNKPLDEDPFWRPLEAIIEDGVQDNAPADVVLDVVRLLTEYKADVNFWYDGRELTPLLAAMSFPDRALPRMLLEKGADPNVFDAYGFSPLMMAVKDSNLGLVRTLLDHGAKKGVNDCSPSVGFGALRIAIGKLDAPMVKLLLDAGADPHAKTLDWDTPMSALPKRNESNAEKWDAVTALVAARDQKSHL